MISISLKFPFERTLVKVFWFFKFGKWSEEKSLPVPAGQTQSFDPLLATIWQTKLNNPSPPIATTISSDCKFLSRNSIVSFGDSLSTSTIGKGKLSFNRLSKIFRARPLPDFLFITKNIFSLVTSA